MSQPHLSYPRWYLGIRGFVIGMGTGMLLTWFLVVSGEVPVGGLWRQSLLPFVIGTAVFTITGAFELVLAVQRFRRVRRQVSGASAAI